MRLAFSSLIMSIGLVALAAGCAQPVNPSFRVSEQMASADLARMSNEPRALQRPLVIVGGLDDPGFVPHCLWRHFDSIAMSDRMVRVEIKECFTFDDSSTKVIEAVDSIYPSASPRETVEVDVVAFSIGGLVARYAALPPEQGQRRLRIARLFTISSPLRGSTAAKWTPGLYPVIRDIRPGSPFIERLSAIRPDYPVYSYVRLDDHIIGEENASLPGRAAWWVPTPPLSFAHYGAPFDERILADISRRLRDEPPLALEPPAPLPAKK